MDRQKLAEWIALTYNADPEFPWADSPESMVFRHRGNGKWFALVMEVPREKLGLAGSGGTDVLNVKGDPPMIGSLRGEPGVLPAYHMNKEHWVSLVLDTVEEERLKMLLDVSFALTSPKAKRKKGPAGLASMKNIGKELARKLTRVGVDSPEKLLALGAKEAFARMKEAYPNVCLVHLYALEGAVEGVDYSALPQEVKADLKAFSDSLKEKQRGGIPCGMDL